MFIQEYCKEANIQISKCKNLTIAINHYANTENECGAMGVDLGEKNK